MKRVTVTIREDIESILDAYLRPVQAALREYLEHRGFGARPKRLRITPAKKGSGIPDTSLRHDRYLAGE